MLVFAVCLFGAHPDFWLADAEFYESNRHIRNAQEQVDIHSEIIAKLYDLMADPQTAKWARPEVDWRNRLLAKEALPYLDLIRVEERTRAFVSPKDYSGAAPTPAPPPRRP